nr:NifU family protein [Actinomyces bowdenii]
MLRRRPAGRAAGGGGAPVPVHPLSTPDPAVLKWVVPDGLLPFTGPVATAPPALQALLDDATLGSVHATAGAVLTLLGQGRSWGDEGARVRTALAEALTRPDLWEPVTSAQALGPDEVLLAAAQEIAEGPVGELAHRHGGAFLVRGARQGIVEVALEGACHDCPAAVITMHTRFERLLRRRCPWLVEVRRTA